MAISPPLRRGGLFSAAAGFGRSRAPPLRAQAKCSGNLAALIPSVCAMRRQTPAGVPGHSSDMPPACHSLLRPRFAAPFIRGAFGGRPSAARRADEGNARHRCPAGDFRPVGAGHVRPAAFPWTAARPAPPGRACPAPTKPFSSKWTIAASPGDFFNYTTKTRTCISSPNVL